MATPTFEDFIWTKGTASGTATLNLPASGISAGDRLIAICSHDYTADWTGYTDSTSDAWVLRNNGVSSTEFRLGVFDKTADGDENGETLNLTHSGGSETFCGVVIRVSGVYTVEIGSATGSSTTPDPPSKTDSAGSEDNLWIATAAVAVAIGSSPTGPSGYTFNATQGQSWDQTGPGGGESHLMFAYRSTTATEIEDPGTFDSNYGSPQAWRALTICVRPSATSSSTSAAGAATASAVLNKVESYMSASAAGRTITIVRWPSAGGVTQYLQAIGEN